MKKTILVIMTMGCLALAIVIAMLSITEDKQGPEITLEEMTITYTQGDPYEELIVGITAMDNKDGDVTDSIKVAGIYPDTTGTDAKVIYAAKDSRNNVTEATRTVKYISTDEPFSPEVQPNENEADTADTMDIPDREETTSDFGANSENQEGQETTLPLPLENPVITLTDSVVTVSKGASINRLVYVKDITDDKDERQELFRNIQIDGEVDTTVSGSNELIYTVSDSDGNRSNQAKLTVIVQ